MRCNTLQLWLCWPRGPRICRLARLLLGLLAARSLLSLLLGGRGGSAQRYVIGVVLGVWTQLFVALPWLSCPLGEAIRRHWALWVGGSERHSVGCARNLNMAWQRDLQSACNAARRRSPTVAGGGLALRPIPVSCGVGGPD